MMKLLFIIRSRIAARKKYFILVCITLILSSTLFNIVFNSAVQYILDIAYIDKNRYESSVVLLELSSYEPLKRDSIDLRLSENGIEGQWHYFINTLGLYAADTPINGYTDYKNKTTEFGYLSENPQSERGCVVFYDKEYSEFVDTSLIGEKPDLNKDYGGKLPVIAGCSSALDIGDSAKYNCAGTVVTLTVVGRYADNNIARYLAGRYSLDNDYYTDIEILRKYGAYPTEEKLPSFAEYNKGKDIGDRIINSTAIIIENAEDAPFPETIAKAYELKNEAKLKTDEDMFGGYIRVGVLNDSNILSREAVDWDNQELIKLIPLFAAIFLIGTAGIIASVILSTDSSIKSTAVFRLCGCKNKNIALISVLSELFAVLPSLIISTGLCYVLCLISPVNAMTTGSFIFTAAYMLLLFAIMTVTEIITLTRSRMLDTIRRFETL